MKKLTYLTMLSLVCLSFTSKVLSNDSELVPWDCVIGDGDGGYNGVSPDFVLENAAETCEGDGGRFYIIVL